jgi:hypothetical protein
MLLTFKTRAHANITMFGEVGKKMLEMMDFGSRIPGAIRAEDLPSALANLEAALNRMPREENPPPGKDDQPKVGLHTRAMPLIELLKAAIEDEDGVSWE